MRREFEQMPRHESVDVLLPVHAVEMKLKTRCIRWSDITAAARYQSQATLLLASEIWKKNTLKLKRHTRSQAAQTIPGLNHSRVELHSCTQDILKCVCLGAEED